MRANRKRAAAAVRESSGTQISSVAPSSAPKISSAASGRERARLAKTSTILGGVPDKQISGSAYTASQLLGALKPVTGGGTGKPVSFGEPFTKPLVTGGPSIPSTSGTTFGGGPIQIPSGGPSIPSTSGITFGGGPIQVPSGGPSIPSSSGIVGGAPIQIPSGDPSIPSTSGTGFGGGPLPVGDATSSLPTSTCGQSYTLGIFSPGCGQAELPGGVSGPVDATDEDHHFFPTPAYVTWVLMDCENFEGTVWEPACGDGAISNVLRDAGYEVHSSDIVDPGYREVEDFLQSARQAECVVTNPPYRLAEHFVKKALDCTTRKVAMFLPLSFLSSKRRFDWLPLTPLKHVLVFTNRVNLYPNGVRGTLGSGILDYAWFIWEHGYQGAPLVRCLPPNAKDAA